MYLTNILVGTPLLHKVAIVNDNGEVRGHITVSVRLVLIDEMDEKSNSVLVNFEGFGEVGEVLGRWVRYVEGIRAWCVAMDEGTCVAMDEGYMCCYG